MSFLRHFFFDVNMLQNILFNLSNNLGQNFVITNGMNIITTNEHLENLKESTMLFFQYFK